MTKASATPPFATTFGAETQVNALDTQQPGQLRQRCCYCDVKHMTDGLGPVLDGELVSDGACADAFAVLMAALDAEEARRA